MELRHLRCFLAVAEELHFARAVERLHIEQSPLSRAIKELEEDLGVQLFLRTTRSTRLTRAGTLFPEYVPRVFTVLQQARDSVKAAANGFHGQLRVALSDGIPPSRFSTFLALCRQEEPEIEIRLSEVPLAQQIKGLHEWQNGADESFNGKFRDECLSLEWFRTRTEAKVVIEQRRRHYNAIRPHSSLAYLTPDEFKQRYCSTEAIEAVLQD